MVISSSSLIPKAISFYKNYLYLTEGLDRRLQTNKIEFYFKRSQHSMTSDKEHKLVYCLLQYHVSENGFFSDDKQYLRFFAGIVHYCPKILYNQLKENNYEKRYHVALLMKSCISLLVASDYSLDMIFSMKFRETSEYSFLVLKTFLNCYQDESDSICKLFLETSYTMLICMEKILSSVIIESIQAKVLYLCIFSKNLKIQKLSISIIAQIMQCMPQNLYSEQNIIRLIKLCFNMKFEFSAKYYEKMSTIYRNLYEHYPKHIFYLPAVGKIMGALFIRLDQLYSGPKIISKHLQAQREFELKCLYDILMNIRDFLENQPST